MGKKCLPGIICIENMTLFVIILLVLITIFLFLNLKTITTVQFDRFSGSSNLDNPTTPTILNSVNINGISTRNDPFNDPYMPPIQSNGIFLRDSVDVHGMPFMRTNIPSVPVNVQTRRFDTGYLSSIPVNVQTRGLNTGYDQVGILTRSNGRDDMILPLMGRQSLSGRSKYQYYTISNNGNINAKLPVRVKGRSCTSEVGCDEITSNDTIFVEGYKDTFIATVYENGSLSYIPYI